MVPIVTIPGDTTTEEVPDLAPNITPCNTNSDYTIKVFKHPTLDAMAIEDTEANTVEVYSWVQEVGEDGKSLSLRLNPSSRGFEQHKQILFPDCLM